MKLLKGLFENNKKTIFLYFVIVVTILPLQSIGFSTHTASIIGEARKNISKTSIKNMSRSILIISFIWLFTHVLYIIKRRITIHNSLNFSTYLKNEIHKIYIKKYSVAYEESKVGNIITAIETMPWLFEKLFQEATNVILPYTTAIFFLIVYFYYVDYRVGSIILFLALFLMGTSILFKGSIQEKVIQEYELNENLNESVNDRLSNVINIIASNNQNKEQEIFKKNEEKLRNTREHILVKSWYFYSFIDIIIFLFILFTLFTYLYLFKKYNKIQIKNEKLIGSFLVFFYFLSYIGRLKWATVQFLLDYSIIDYFMKKHDSHLKEYEKNKHLELKNDFIKTGLIEIKNLDYSRKNKVIHKSLNLRFYPNEVTGIFGESGCGKTTLLLLLLGMYKPKKGSILIDGVDIKYASREYLSSQIGFLSQNTILNNSSIIKNIGKPEKDIREAIKILNVGNIFKNINLHRNVGLYGSNLSNGQRQMVNIIRLYLENKKINLFDEPTSSLDPKTKKLILNVLHKIKREGKTIIVVSHDDMIIKNVDNVINL